MKLNRAIKQSFVLAALNDVPQPVTRDALAAEVMKAAISLLPEAAKKAWADEAARAFINVGYWHSSDGTSAAIPAPDNHEHYKKFVKKVSETARVAALMSAMQEQTKARNELRDGLRCLVDSCTTIKQLEAAAPELARYLPAETGARTNLPVGKNIVEALRAQGWPAKQSKNRT